MDSLTPMMRQYHEVKREYPDALLFFRMGDFYEMFFDDAVQAARELEITLTSRSRDKNGIPVPMCGVPYHSVGGYIARLIKNGHRVAICEQVEDPRTAVGIVKREVIRVVTPGTITDDLLLEPKSHNYLAALHFSLSSAGIALVDLSTGHLTLSDLAGENFQEDVMSLLSSFSPAEILVPETLRSQFLHSARLQDFPNVTGADDWTFHNDQATRVLEEQFGVATLDGFGVPSGSLAVCAAAGLIRYLRKTQKAALDHIRNPTYLRAADFLRMDASSVANLELVQAVDGSRKWTLFSILDFTQTGMGARLLKEWLLRPSLDLRTISCRQDSVERLKENVILRREIVDSLSKIRDLDRLLSKTTLGLAKPRHLVSLAASRKQLPKLKDTLAKSESEPLRQLGGTLDPLEDVAELLEASIANDPPVSLQDGGIIRDGYNAELDELRGIQRDGKSYIAAIENRERERTKITSLKVKYNQVFGYFIEVTRP